MPEEQEALAAEELEVEPGEAVSDDTVSGDADEQIDEPAPEPTVEEQLAERTADLQRLQAEYSNYRKRVERDRALARSAGEGSVLRSMLTVLDDIGRAEEHGELTGGFKAVADSLRAAVKSHRLDAFGAKGDVFDPRLHEALFHAGESAEVEATTVDSVVRLGYRVGDDVLRHAQVGVVDPVEGEVSRKPADTESVKDEPPAGEAD
ncbi:MAG TPA: nucleotide exchange factor GrpE [Aeromicrobium sp.]|nr:nucleotide exchange factor GrpE [Aeromicrobium sp.]